MEPSRTTRWIGASAALVSALGVVLAEASSTGHRALIPTTVGILVAKHKRGKGGDEVEDDTAPALEPSQPITRFLFGAINDGDYGDVDLHVAADLTVFLNGFRVGAQDLGGQGTLALAENVENWRKIVPDLSWTLHDEVVSKDRSTVAVRFTVAGTHTGTAPGIEPTGASLSYQVSVFLHLVDGKLSEIHQTVDLHQVMDDLGLEPD